MASSFWGVEGEDTQVARKQEEKQGWTEVSSVWELGSWSTGESPRSRLGSQFNRWVSHGVERTQNEKSQSKLYKSSDTPLWLISGRFSPDARFLHIGEPMYGWKKVGGVASCLW